MYRGSRASPRARSAGRKGEGLTNFEKFHPERKKRPNPREDPPKLAVLSGGRLVLNPNARDALRPVDYGIAPLIELLCDPAERIIGLHARPGQNPRTRFSCTISRHTRS